MYTFHAGSEDASASVDSIPNSPEDEPLIVIVIQDTDSECEGYHSSDFEFITESDAEKDGIIATQRTQQTTSCCEKSCPNAKKRTLSCEIDSPNNCKVAKSCENNILFSETASKMATPIIQSFGRSLRSNTDSPTESKYKMATGDVSCNEHSSFSSASAKFKMAPCENNSSNVDSPGNSKMATPVVPSYGTRSYSRGLRGAAARSVPEGQSYVDLFLMVGHPSTGSIENKIVTPPACMSIGRELGFDMRTICREERDAEIPQLKLEARGSVQKILQMYPEQNDGRRY